MPPSPVMRVFSRRELKVENHKRGRSLESLYREKEDDLALFSEVRNRERDNFLLQPNDNFDDFLSLKLRNFSDYKLGISIPASGESSDLLNADRDKTDYDWLITPPETPLFRSLDDEPQPLKHVPRGRPRNQPVSITRSPTMEKEYSRGRGSASPHRLSPSPRSGNSTLQSRSRAISATRSSPPHTTRHLSPGSRLSPPPSKPTSSPRSVTPTPRRMSTGSSGTSAPSRVRGSSPIKMSQGNSASPKTRAWQTNIPGFSSEAPPNLRTSPADGHVRGTSPVSRNGSRYGRQSMSPTASRSAASSYSHDRDLFCSYSKGSVASSGDDDIDWPQSIPFNTSEQSPRNMGGCPSNNATSFSRKPMKRLSSSAPKRYFDSVHQTDHKGPHNMFRPLLSSVPHAGKTSAHNRALISRNSSMTTSSNASSDQAACGVHEAELNQEDLTSDCVKGHFPATDDELFVVDHVDSLSEDVVNRIMGNSLGENDVLPAVVSPLDVGSSKILNAPDIVTCSKCGRMLNAAELVTGRELQFCLECRCLEVRSVITDPPNILMVGVNKTLDIVQVVHGLEEVFDQSASVPECIKATCTGQTGKTHFDSQNSYSDSSQSLCVEVFEEGEPTVANEKMIEQPMDEISTGSRLDVSKGAGISLLLNKSSSLKGYLVQSRSFTASTTSYDDFSYGRDSLNSMRCSTERTAASLSSSTDMGSSTQAEYRNIWQSRSRKSDKEDYTKSISSMSSAPCNMSQIASVTQSSHEDSFEVIAGCINKELGEEICVDVAEAESTCSDIERNVLSKTASKLSICSMNEHSVDTPMHSFLTSQEAKVSNPETSSVHSPASNQVYDAAEVRNPSSLNHISEIEIENDEVVYYDSNSDADSSNSKGCTNELHLHDAGSVTTTVKEFETSYHENGALEESKIVLGEMAEANARSLILEEAEDAIHFCSSIVHNLVKEAVNIAVDNETLQVEVLQPSTMFVGNSNYERRDRSFKNRSSRPEKAQRKSMEMETTPSSCNPDTYKKSSSPRILGPPDDGALDNGESLNHPKLDSKCNCTLM